MVQKKKIKVKSLPKNLPKINPYAAGIDIGSKSHFVAIPEGGNENHVKEFSAFTCGLHEIVNWLTQNHIKTVAMESTGVYWISLYDLLESKGFEVLLVNAKHVKNVPGKKTDVLDCQWIQQLHSYGLLRGSFRPTQNILKMRTLMRHRATLIEYASSHLQHIQKSLTQMNIKLANVISDISGLTGMKIIRAIASGERDPKVLASHRDTKCKNSEKTIEESLRGSYREEHVFCLKQALQMYDFYGDKIHECEIEIERIMKPLETQSDTSKLVERKKHIQKKQVMAFDMHKELIRVTGVDLTAIPGFNIQTASKIISEVGLDMNRWPTAKHFASWLGLCPGNKVSGGKRLSGKTTPSANRAAQSFRIAANTLRLSDSALGAFFRRKNGVLGAAKTITATAHKLAVILYNMLKYGMEYVEKGLKYYEDQYRSRCIKSLEKKAAHFGFQIVPIET